MSASAACLASSATNRLSPGCGALQRSCRAAMPGNAHAEKSLSSPLHRKILSTQSAQLSRETARRSAKPVDASCRNWSCASSVSASNCVPAPLPLSSHSSSFGCPCRGARAFSTAVPVKEETAGNDAAVTTLFQYTVCPYCTAVRTTMDFFSHPYKAVEVNPFSKKEILGDPRLDKTYKKVPIALIDGQQVNDSREIIRRLCVLHRRGFREGSSPSASGALSPAEETDLDWVYSNLVVVFPASLYPTLAASWRAFGFITALSNLSPLEKVVVRLGGPLLMYSVSRMNKKKHGITDPVEALSSACREWMTRVKAAGGASGPLHGGAKPDMADVVAVGFFQALKDAQTLRAVRAKDAEFGNWLRTAEKAVLR
ncbi:glutathione S-transferase, N-terminal domain-containing protein [Besnoitia besnoiti]|uniref:Glutathione S-transferase, N-terminal domain-containing protein n=1 Tax=Besnoitia besnoiti TaxID=94643 RepID=A0A2A9MJG9_BESBE|nr:glutathione S-transferase, N-terminal domain-containing protein [Besnoitia besnoiti]PFH38059.1 glutathione S-transferase, N-terminal domain-containing protein [Besnoitia besnoiti]